MQLKAISFFADEEGCFSKSPESPCSRGKSQIMAMRPEAAALAKKTWLVMKLTSFLLLVICLRVTAAGYSQTITLSVNEEPLEKVLASIERQSHVNFFYSYDVLRDVRKVTIDLKNATLETALSQLFRNQPLNYIIKKRTVFINKKEPKNQSALQAGKMSEVQPRDVSGHVTDEQNHPIEGASILIRGTGKGTVTDAEGKFFLSVPEKSVLIFSFIGYASQEIKYSDQQVINIQLKKLEDTMQNIVVVGYGVVKKSDLTGSVSSVKADQLTDFPALTAIQALQGRAAGVQIQSNNGEPGSGFKIRVRGQTSINAGSDPLFVVDGFVDAPLPAPEDIASMDILKDASATSIYGSRGANGVILVTTKSGSAGKARLNVNASNSSQGVINKLNVLNADQFVDYVKEATPNYTRGTGNTDWQDEIFRTGRIQNYQAGAAGGSERMNYYVSGTYFDQEGVVINSKYKRIAVQSNLNFQASEKLKLGLNLLLRRTSRDGIRSQEFSGGDGSGVLSAAVRFAPDLPVYNEDGSFTLNSIGDPGDNPYAIASQLQNNGSNDEMVGNAYGEYQLLKGLKLRVNVGINTSNGRTGNYIPTTLNQGRNAGGIASIDAYQASNFLNEDYLSYSTTFGASHKLNVVAGYSYQKGVWENYGSRGQTFITDAFSFWNLGSANIYLAPSSLRGGSELVSGYSRINYTLMDRFLLTLSGRYDGYSAFSKNNKYAFFPSGAFAWNIKQEEFLKNAGWIDQLKLRVSYGATGNQAIDPYQTLARLSTEIAVIGGQQVTAVRPTTVANDNLTWESTMQFDLGADLSFFNSRVNVTADYYKKTTSDLLFSVPLPQYTGYSTQLQNIGKVENKGFEFMISSRNLTGGFKWNTDFNISFNRNKILELPDGQDITYGTVPGHLIGTGTMQLLRVGQPVGLFYGYIYDGVYQEGETFIPGSGFEQAAGGEKYRDINGRDADYKFTNAPDGQLDEDDKTIIGNPHPKFIWSINNDFKWKGFDVNIFFQASEGNDLYSFTLMELGRNSGGSNATTKALDRWTPSHTNTNVAAVNAGRSYLPSSQWLFDGSYIRLKNIAVGYSLPASVIGRLKLRGLRCYVSAQNILTFTKYEGYDPEVNYLSGSGSSGNMNLGLDYGSYPNAKSVTLGFNLDF